MKHLTIILGTLLLAQSYVAMAQEDDMYFTARKDKKEKAAKAEKNVHKVEIIYEDAESAPVADTRITATVPASGVRDVDEYNRRGRRPSSVSDDTLTTDMPVADTRQVQTYELSAQSLYDLGYSEGYSEGFSDGNDMDYYYGLRLARFHGCRFYDPWYWNRVSYVYDPWHWDPWYWDPWYRPYYYGGWYSVGWGIGYYGCYWNPYWPGYYPHYPHHPHWGHGGHHAYHGPRVSTSRNRDYGRARIADRSYRTGERRQDSSGRNVTDNRAVNRGNDRTSRFNERSSSRSTRVTDRTTDRTTNRSVNRNTDRSGRSNVERPSNRSSNRSSSRIGSSTSSSRGGGFGSRGRGR